jgi:hypothetical protein
MEVLWGAKGTGIKKEGPGRTLGPKNKVILLSIFSPTWPGRVLFQSSPQLKSLPYRQ